MTTEVVPTDAAQETSTAAESLKHLCPFFDESRMSPSTHEYVCWIDVMGSQSIMLRSLRVASNFLMKLHVAAIRASTPFTHTVELYPMIDGIYVCSQSKSHILSFLKNVYKALAVEFVLEADPFHRFQIRGGLAFGPIVKGEGTLDCADELRDNPDHAKRILLGPTLTQAYQTEKKSTPFGIALHESVRTFAPSGEVVMFETYWKWWKLHNTPIDERLVSELFTSLKAHYEWCSKHTVALSYDQDDIRRHENLMEEYFSD